MACAGAGDGEERWKVGNIFIGSMSFVIFTDCVDLIFCLFSYVYDSDKKDLIP